jgi:hypothetical protein
MNVKANYPERLKPLYLADCGKGDPDYWIVEYTNELPGEPGRNTFHCMMVIPPAPEYLLEVFDFYAQAIMIKSVGEHKRSQRRADRRVLAVALKTGTFRPSATEPLPELERA